MRRHDYRTPKADWSEAQWRHWLNLSNIYDDVRAAIHSRLGRYEERITVAWEASLLLVCITSTASAIIVLATGAPLVGAVLGANIVAGLGWIVFKRLGGRRDKEAAAAGLLRTQIADECAEVAMSRCAMRLHDRGRAAGALPFRIRKSVDIAVEKAVEASLGRPSVPDLQLALIERFRGGGYVQLSQAWRVFKTDICARCSTVLMTETIVTDQINADRFSLRCFDALPQTAKLLRLAMDLERYREFFGKDPDPQTGTIVAKHGHHFWGDRHFCSSCAELGLSTGVLLLLSSEQKIAV
jgi:hypothetical protein